MPVRHNPQPLFREFVRAALEYRDGRAPEMFSESEVPAAGRFVRD